MSPIPTTLPNNESGIKTIAAGGNHTLILTTTGTVYAAGCNADGRCGPRQTITSTPETSNILRFRQLVFPDPVSGPTISNFKHVSATWEGTIVVASVSQDRLDEDKVFVFGSSPKGELGIGLETLSAEGSCIPSFPPAGVNIVALASGMAHSAVVLGNGEVWGWGASRKGQLGDGNRGVRIAYSPVKVLVPLLAERVVCGREFTVVSGGGRFVVLGDGGNRWGFLDVPVSLGVGGRGGEEKCGGCEGFISSCYTDIGASWHGVYVHAAPGLDSAERLRSDGEALCASSRVDGQTGAGSDVVGGSLVAWGRNDRGQLPPGDLPTPVKVAVGSEHVLALLGDGRVAAFGWGEHGNCGPETDSQGNVSGKYSVIALPEDVGANEEVVGVGAGCATSWIVVS